MVLLQGMRGRLPSHRDPPRLALAGPDQLVLLEATATLEFLSSPPGNRLEALEGDRKGQHSIRINDQWRICFCWTTAGPEDVEIVDYR